MGVDIDEMSIRAVEARTSARGEVEIQAYREAALPAGSVKNGRVVEVATVATVLKSMWAAAQFKTKDVMLGIGDQNVVARELTLPRVTNEELGRMLPTRVQELIPMPVAEAILDFYATTAGPADDQGQAMRGLLVAAHLDAVTVNVEAVRAAGLRIVGVDFVPFALQRAVGLSDRETSAIIDVGVSSTNVIISAKGVPDFVRIIPLGSDEIARALAGRLEVPRDEAERLMMRGAPEELFALHSVELVSSVIVEASRELVSNVVNTLRYYSSARDGQQVGALVLSGSGARVRGLAEEIARATGIQPQPPQTFERLGLARQFATLGPGISLRAGAAVGLAMGGRA